MVSDEELIEDVLIVYAQRTAQTSGGLSTVETVNGIRSFWRKLSSDDIEQYRHVNRNATAAYLKGSVFSLFTRDHVEAWALWRLSHMPQAEAVALLETAAVAGKGDIQSILFQLVKYFSVR
jgi:hypothetical protein